MSKSREQLVNYLKEIDITDKVVLDAGCGPKEKVQKIQKIENL